MLITLSHLTRRCSHRFLIQATAIVTERLNANKAPTPANDPKNPRSAVNNNKDLDVDVKQDAGFFGSFFTAKSGPKKKGVAAMEAPPPNIRPQAALNERETMETEVISAYLIVRPLERGANYTFAVHLIQSLQCYSNHTLTELLIHSYFNIVKREMIDMVPKAISLTLVSYSKENLQRELLQELYKPEVLDELLKESDYVVSRRKELQSMVAALNKAEEYVLFTPFLCAISSVFLQRTAVESLLHLRRALVYKCFLDMRLTCVFFS